MSSKDKPPATKTKNVNSTTLNSNQKDKGKQIVVKSSKRTLEDYAFPIQTLQGIASDMSKSKPLTFIQKSWTDIAEEDYQMQAFCSISKKLRSKLRN